MKINSLIIHELKKERREKATWHPSKEKVAVDDNMESFCKDLIDSFSKYKSKTYGKFENPTLFQKTILSNIKNKSIPIKDTINIIGSDSQGSLVSYLNNEPLSTGAYVILLSYSINSNNFYYVCLMNNKNSSRININRNGKAVIKKTEYIDFKNINYACRVNFSKVNTQDSCLHFVNKSTQDVSQYFKNFIGCTNFYNRDKNTSSLVEIIKTLSKEESDPSRIKGKAVTFCTEKLRDNEPIRLPELSLYVFNDSEKLANYISEKKIEIDDEFSIAKTKLKMLQKLKFTGDWIDQFVVDFDKLTPTNYTIDKQNNSIVLRNVPKLIDTIESG